MSKPAHYPFSYHEGMQLQKSKPKKKIITDIKKLFADRQLDESDTIILNMLCKYKYLNAFLIRVLLEQNHVSCNQNYVTKKLAFLEARGLIARFQFTYRDKEQIEHATPFIYEAAYKTKKLFLGQVTVEPEEANELILRQLSYNQFHIFLSKQMAGALTFSSIHFNGKSDGTYRFMSQGRVVTFYAFSQRLSDDWRAMYAKRLKAFKEHMQKNNLTCSGIIVICENEMHSLLAEQYRKSIAECNNLPVYYICDYAAVKEGFLLGQLIYVKPDKDFTSYDIIKVPVDGNVFYNVSDKQGASIETNSEINLAQETSPGQLHKTKDTTSEVENSDQRKQHKENSGPEIKKTPLKQKVRPKEETSKKRL